MIKEKAFTRIRGCIIDHMLQIKIDTPDVGILGHNEIEGGSGASTDIDQLLDAFKSLVSIQDLLHDQGRVIGHGSVEDLVEPGISSMVFKCSHSIGLVERDPTVQDCFFKVVPENKIWLLRLVDCVNKCNISKFGTD